MTDVQTIPFKVTGADGKETEIAVPMSAVLEAVKDTHVPKDRIAADLDRRAQAIVKNQNLRKPEDLLEDEAFVAQVLEKHGHVKNDGDATKQLKDALAKQRADWDAKELGPLRKTLEQKEEREQSLLVRDLERQIVQAAAPLVRDSLLKSPGKGKSAPIVTMLEDAFAYDEETGEFYVADGDNFVLSTSADKTTTYKTVSEFVEEWAASPDNKDFTKPGQAGPGVQGGGARGGRAGDGTVTLTAEEASDGRVWAKAMEKVGGDASKIRVQRRQSQTYY